MATRPHPSGALILLLSLYLATASLTPSLTPPLTHSTLGDDCTHVFLDLGSNLGVQVRKFFEPQLFQRQQSSLLRALDHTFGYNRTHSLQQRSSNCVFSFEPNPKHTHRLQHMQAVYQSLGYRYMHFPVAVSTENSTVTLLREVSSNDAAAKLIKNKADLSDKRLQQVASRTGTTVDTHTIDFVEFLQKHIMERKLPEGVSSTQSRVMIKMDIEGEEYSLLPALVSSGVLCRTVDVLLVEWHVRNSRWFLKGVLPLPIDREKVLAFQRSVKLLLTLSKPACRTDMRKLDDESYMGDTLVSHPLPRLASHSSSAFS
jgi:hypothetical protein